MNNKIIRGEVVRILLHKNCMFVRPDGDGADIFCLLPDAERIEVSMRTAAPAFVPGWVKRPIFKDRVVVEVESATPGRAFRWGYEHFWNLAAAKAAQIPEFRIMKQHWFVNGIPQPIQVHTGGMKLPLLLTEIRIGHVKFQSVSVRNNMTTNAWFERRVGEKDWIRDDSPLLVVEPKTARPETSQLVTA